MKFLIRMDKKAFAKNNFGKNWNWNKGLITTLTLFCLFLLIIFSSLTLNEIKYHNKILPGIKIGGLKVGGLSAQAAQQLIQTEVDKLLSQGLIFTYGEEKIIMQNSLQSLDDPDVNLDLITYQILPSVKQALELGHSPSTLNNLKDQVKILVAGVNIPLLTTVQQSEIKDIINRDMRQIVTPAKSAGIVFTDELPTITEATSGQIIDWPNVFAFLNQQLQNLSPINIPLGLTAEEPQVTKAEAVTSQARLNHLVDIKPTVKLTDDKSNYSLAWTELKEWLVWEKNNDQPIISLATDKLDERLQEIAKIINQPTKDAKFEIQNGRVVKFQGSQDGYELNIDKSIELIKNNFANNIFDNQLIVSPLKARVATADINNLGIREIIGIGRSNFSGSPVNRRHNIKVGADTLNGILIKPGEEFSLLKALGKVDAAAGYLPELVIKGNKTIPEYGGGLCQIGTTTFRATLATGLPVLARRNHSYRVRYYEPAGTDATIYDPAPDYKFLNDTNNHVLIQTRIESDELIFEFWGTRDGRQIKQTEPQIYNITPAPPTTYIETLDLKPGEEKCTESAHAGADAEFTYTVTYIDGKTKTETFKSHYRPWGAICLIGVEELSKPTDEGQTTEATNTEAILNP